MSKPIRAIGFDFDGTLINSEHVKGKIMEDLFLELFGIERGVKAAYHKLLGINREKKIDLLCQQFLGRLPTLTEHRKISKHFGEHYLWELHTCPLFSGINLLKYLRERVTYLFLLSLENTTEVRKLARKCGIAKYFHDVIGGPVEKRDNLRCLLKIFHPEEILYVGDAPADVRIAKGLGIRVVQVGSRWSYLRPDLHYSSLEELEKDVLEMEGV